MDYYINRLLPVTFDEAVARTKEALKTEGFGVLTEINVQETLKTKIGVDYPSKELASSLLGRRDGCAGNNERPLPRRARDDSRASQSPRTAKPRLFGRLFRVADKIDANDIVRGVADRVVACDIRLA
jgi:hypothetical protein